MPIVAQRVKATTGDRVGAHDFREAENGGSEATTSYNEANEEYLVVWEGPAASIPEREIFGQRLSGGIGDTLRVSLTVPNDRKREEVEAGRQIVADVAAGRSPGRHSRLAFAS